MGRQHHRIETIQGRNYTVIDILSQKNGTRLKVSFEGKFFTLLILPEGPETWQHVLALDRLGEDNRNYPRVIDRERRNGEIRLVTSWIEGYTLRWYLERGRERPQDWPSVSRTVTLIRGLAHALFFVHHRANLVHIDLKPANLVLARTPDRLVMIDFGSALTAEAVTKRVEGDGATLAYAAPEIWTQTPNFQADLFSVSVIAFEMLTGRLPFDGLGGKIGHPDFVPETMPTPERPSSIFQHAGRYPKSFRRSVDNAIMTGLMVSREKRFPAPEDFRNAWNQVSYDLDNRWTLSFINDLFRRFRK